MPTFRQDLARLQELGIEPTQLPETQRSSLPRLQDDLSNFDTNIPGFAQEIQGDIGVEQAKLEKKVFEKQQRDLENDVKLKDSDLGDVDLSSVAEQATVLSRGGEITQEFGQKSKFDVFSGGVNYGTDIAVPEGTTVAAPKGQWEVVHVFDGSKNGGFIGNKVNSGYGNSVLLKNQKTGEMLRFSHLSPGINVTRGQMVNGGQIFGRTGSSGNVTGAHLDLEFYDKKGRIANVRKSGYWNSLFDASGGGDPEGFFSNLFGGVKSFVKENITGTPESRKESRSKRTEALQRAFTGDTSEFKKQTQKDAENLAIGATASPRMLSKLQAQQLGKAALKIAKPQNIQSTAGSTARETIEDMFASIKRDIPGKLIKRPVNKLTVFDKADILKQIVGMDAPDIASKLGVVTGKTKKINL